MTTTGARARIRHPARIRRPGPHPAPRPASGAPARIRRPAGTRALVAPSATGPCRQRRAGG
ncbi:MAG: dihydrolipoamide acetyltransferase, partial [Actinomycetota bacterium]|nr:dihydrolipoamide acetyltransferase [Actinomycetota bacterium]